MKVQVIGYYIMEQLIELGYTKFIMRDNFFPPTESIFEYVSEQYVRISNQLQNIYKGSNLDKAVRKPSRYELYIEITAHEKIYLLSKGVILE